VSPPCAVPPRRASGYPAHSAPRNGRLVWGRVPDGTGAVRSDIECMSAGSLSSAQPRNEWGAIARHALVRSTDDMPIDASSSGRRRCRPAALRHPEACRARWPRDGCGRQRLESSGARVAGTSALACLAQRHYASSSAGERFIRPRKSSHGGARQCGAPEVPGPMVHCVNAHTAPDLTSPATSPGKGW